MNRAEFPTILANLRRAGNPAADAKARELAAVPTVAGGAVAALDGL